MHFWKYCGAGNDFVILENFDGSIAPERYAALPRRCAGNIFPSARTG